MSKEVKNNLNEYEAKDVLKTCPKIIKDYVKALKSAIEGSQRTTQNAISKIKVLDSENTKLKEENRQFKGVNEALTNAVFENERLKEENKKAYQAGFNEGASAAATDIMNH